VVSYELWLQPPIFEKRLFVFNINPLDSARLLLIPARAPARDLATLSWEAIPAMVSA
jgi:hypothetical protein